MKESSSKGIIILILVIVVLFGIYKFITKNDNKKEKIKPENYVSVENEKVDSNEIRIGIIEFDNINPIISNNKNVQDISRLIFDSLFTLTQDEYKLEADLAKECSKIADKTYVIKLKDGINWHDGNKFDAFDVEFTIDMLKKIGSDSVYYYNVKDIEEVEVIDETTIKLKTNKDIPFYEYNLIFPIVSCKYYNEDNFLLESKNIKTVGTGRYYISETTNNNIILKKSVANFDKKSTKLDIINLKLYSSLSETINAFKESQIDIFTTANKDIDEYLKHVNYNKVDYINRNYSYLALNCDNNILNNIEVRQAINASIDKNEIANNLHMNAIVSNFPLDYGSYAYDKSNPYIEYDSNNAKRLLVDNNWKYENKKWRKTVNGKYLKIELELVTNKNSNMIKMANMIKENLEKIGIQIKIIEAKDEQYNKYINNKNYDMILVDSTYGYSPSLEKYFGDGNLANYNSESIRETLLKAQNIKDENEIRKEYSSIVEKYNLEVPYISLNYNTSSLIYNKNLKGSIKPNSYNVFYGIENWYREYSKK